MTSKIMLGGFVRIAALIVGFLTLSAGAWADGEHPHPEHDLAKASQNPVAKLISVPFENNATFNNGPEDVFVDVLNIKPVVPMGLTEKMKSESDGVAPFCDELIRPLPSSSPRSGKTRTLWRFQ